MSFKAQLTDDTESNTGCESTATGPNMSVRSSALRRRALRNDSPLRHFFWLPKLPKESFVIAPDRPLPEHIVQNEYNKLWAKHDVEALGLGKLNVEPIRGGVPSMAMAEMAKASMKWENLVQMGACTATYANDKYILQLTNSTIIAVLLSGFSTAALVVPPTFDGRLPHFWPEIFQSVYTLTMLASAIYCFAATGVALHSVNRLSNVCPSRSSVAYMTHNVFHAARDAVEAYVFRGMAFACGGIIVAVTWNTSNLLYGIPALVATSVASIWFIIVYKEWDRMAKFHSDVADKLFAKDILIAAKNGNSVTEGLWTH